MFDKLQIVFGSAVLFLFSACLNAQETCSSNSVLPFEWPGQRNWFIAPNLYSGVVINMETMGVTSVGGPGNSVTSYEGVSAASNDKGELLFYTNGRSLWRGTGNAVTKTYGGLLTGNEGSLSNGSAAQGVITVRHPLDPARYWVITTDDALAPTKGMNAFSFDTLGNLLSGPTRLGTFRTSEGVSATLHSNGIDIWVTCLSSGTGQFHTFLLKCNGFESESVVSPIGPKVTGNRERGGIAYSWDGEYLAQAHPNWWPDGDKIVSIYKFNKSNGQLYDAKNVSGVWGSPYDITWSPNNNRVYVSMQNSTIHYLDISSWNVTSIKNSWTSTGVSSKFTAIELGYDGSLYLSHGQAGGGYLKKMNGDLNTSNSFTSSNVSGTAGMSHLGLPTMFIPPSDEPDIQEAGPYCSTDPPVDLSTLWICSGNDAENPTENPLAYSGNGITDRANGVFNPSVAGPGTHQIIFEYCSVNDTAWITVNNCSSCTAELQNIKPSICIGQSMVLDALVIKASGSGEWTIDSFPQQGTPPTINNDSDTIFDASNLAVTPGTYKLKYTVTDGSSICYDSIYIDVNSVPILDLGPDQVICEGSGAVTFDAGTYSSYAWHPNSETTQTITTDASGEYILTVTDGNNCAASDTINLTVHTMTGLDLGSDIKICPGVDTTLYAGSNWQQVKWNDFSSGDSLKVFIGGIYYVDVIDFNGCSSSDTLKLTYFDTEKINLGNDVTICQGAQTTFNTGNYMSYMWHDGSSENYYVSFSEETVWVEVQDSNGCVSKDTAQVFISASLPVNLGPDLEMCEGDSVQLISGYPDNNYTFTWSNGEPHANITVNFSGIFDVLVEDLVGCSGRDTIAVAVNQLPLIDIGPNKKVCSGQEGLFEVGGSWSSLIWNTGDTLSSIFVSTEGEYSVEIIDENGCKNKDSVYLTVRPNPKPDLGSDRLICLGTSTLFTISNFTRYEWHNGDSIDQYIGFNNELVYVTVMDSNGCFGSDTAEVVVQENLNIDLGLDIDTCFEGGFNLSSGYSSVPNIFLWSTGETTPEITVNSSGNYFVKVTDGNGCEGYDTINVALHQFPTIDIGPDRTICGEDSIILDVGTGWSEVTWNNGTINQFNSIKISGIYSVHVIDQNGCEGTSEMELTVNSSPNVSLGPDQKICPNGSAIFITTPNNFESYVWQDGSTSATFQTSNPQEVSVVVTDINGCIATDTAQMMSFPEIEVNLAPSQTICEGEVYEIIVPDFDSQYYTFLWSDSSISPSLYVQNSGLYSVTVTDSIGCMGFDSIQININPKPKPSVSDADICEGNITTISTGVYESYLWNTGEEKSEIEVGLAGIYTVTVEDAYGCFGSASGVVTVHSKPVIPNLSNQIICEDEQLTLLPSLPEGTYLWKPGGETTSSIQVSEPGTYEAFINSTYGCVDSISIEVSQASNPNINLGSDTNICEGQTLVAGFKSENAIITWNTGEISDSIEIQTTGVYEATITDFNNCSDIDTIRVNVFQKPNPIVPGDTFVCFEEIKVLPLMVVSGARDYVLWSTGDTTREILIDSEGSYEVTLTNLNGCSSKDTVEVFRECPSLIWVPNAFSPDQDGINDFFGPKAINILDFDFYIFNRWGELLFHSTNINHQWDGTYNGKDCQVDIYVWKLYYRTEESYGGYRRQQKYGNVTLLR